MFDDALLVCQEVAIETKTNEPPHPSTTTPPSVGKSRLDIIRGQIDFWKQAAESWQAIGKPFKKQECEAAALALAHAANVFVR